MVVERGEKQEQAGEKQSDLFVARRRMAELLFLGEEDH